MKRTILVILLCLSVLSLAGCVNKNDGATTANTEGVDLDLSALSGTVVYSQVNSMVSEPWNYLGKIVRVKGTLDFYVNFWGDECSTVLIADATACCAQGIEFVWRSDGTYSGSYPDIGDEVTVTGRFETYERDGFSFIHLVDADVNWVSL